MQGMSDPENPTTIKRLVQQIVQLTQKIVDLMAERETLEQERNQYQRERHHYQYRFLEERRKRLHVEHELLEKKDPHYLEGDMDGSSASHAQATMDGASQKAPSGLNRRTEKRERKQPPILPGPERDQARQKVPPRVESPVGAARGYLTQ